jgi:hypothetical protein
MRTRWAAATRVVITEMRGRTPTTQSATSTERAAEAVRRPCRATASAGPVSRRQSISYGRFARVLAVVVLALAQSVQPAYAWGVEGHAVVADIAEAHLSDAARQQVRALLDVEGKTNLNQVASWADMIRLQRRDTSSWHYVDIPLDADRYDPARDCVGGQCVVVEIEEFEKVLASSMAISPERVEALKWVTHLVGDAHQPLHAEDHADKGGNAVPVVGFGKRANLHSVWDTTLIEAEEPDGAALAKRLNGRITPTMIKNWSGSTAADWVNESHEVARKVGYGMLPTMPSSDAHADPEVLDDAYRKAATDAINLRLEQAGIRLADMLNAALDPSAMPKNPAPGPIVSVAPSLGDREGAAQAPSIENRSSTSIGQRRNITPGSATTATRDELCAGPHVSTSVPAAERVAVLAAYGLPTDGRFHVVRLIPPSWGGDDQIANLLPMTLGDEARKSQLAGIGRRLICAGKLNLRQAQTDIAADWSGLADRLCAHGCR